jgi:hypothetical protein
MHKFYTASYDASIYLQQPTSNAGIDPILEVGKLYYGNLKEIQRTLIKFNVTPISASIASGEITGSWKGYLNLKSANSTGLPLEYTIYANAVSESWDMGQFLRFQSTTASLNLSSASVQQGVSWRFRNGVNRWQENTIGGSAVFVAGTTGSANAEGGIWYTASQASQSFSYQPDDIRMDITGLLNRWISGSFVNNGLILRHGLVNEADSLDYGSLKFYSKETNTIFQPILKISWDDSEFVTGSLPELTSSQIIVRSKELRNSYKEGNIVKIKIIGRNLYPTKTFTNSFAYADINYIPQTSYYAVRDEITKVNLIDFSEYTKISCNSEGNYIKLDTSNFPTDRVYRLLFKVVRDGVSEFIEDDLTFIIN